MTFSKRLICRISTAAVFAAIGLLTLAEHFAWGFIAIGTSALICILHIIGALIELLRPDDVGLPFHTLTEGELKRMRLFA